MLDDSEDFPFIPTIPVRSLENYEVQPDGTVDFLEYGYDLKDKAVYESLIKQFLPDIEAKLTDIEELYQVLKWSLNETDVLPKEYEYLLSDERHSEIREDRLLPPNGYLLKCKILFSIYMGDLETAANTLEDKKLAIPMYRNFVEGAKAIIHGDGKISINHFHTQTVR